ncbi:putative RNA-binding protein YlqC (UPF0109 family) [Oikeobacillus pervagus]|uniref:RNA-binding protein KhpA n=1 Tax=Oikeobacillus pervagus TaxID=1325931 RepID=A0AAJ1WIX2_9BACI|nr:KH domain-containing protein [Oikeobacillus pervagus]MDQ0215100.1 putative RNA-binding protein YlqC (UPF0109 family) [Oikeobacillus pervagus]
MKDLILAIVKPLVDDPENVRVNIRHEDERTVYQVSVHKEDVGKIIGKHGRVVKSIRTIVNAVASSQQKGKIQLEIVD